MRKLISLFTLMLIGSIALLGGCTPAAPQAPAAESGSSKPLVTVYRSPT